MDHYMQYAVRDGKTVHISEVERGLRCSCKCPACGATLVAKKGDIVAHHFAHYKQDDCKYGYETSIHLGIKRVLESEKKFLFPALEGTSYFETPETLTKQVLLPLDTVRSEIWLNGIIPDIVVQIGKSQCLIEVFVTHRVDAGKIEKIKRLGIAAVEIDLSHIDRTADDEFLKELLVNNLACKTWLYNPKQSTIEKKRTDEVKQKIQRGEIDEFKVTSIQYCFDAVYGCPLLPKRKKHWNISAHEKCYSCNYFIYSYKNGVVFCNARYRLWEEKRKQMLKYPGHAEPVAFQDTRNYLKELGVCPECGNLLTMRNGKSGLFLACKGFPGCKYSRNIDQITGEIEY